MLQTILHIEMIGESPPGSIYRVTEAGIVATNNANREGRRVWPARDLRTRGVSLREPVNDEDRRDIAASLDGDERSFARLIERYEGTVAHQMWRFTRDEAELESLTQEVFVEVYFSLAGYKAKAPFLHWLRRIATRVGYRYWKRQARERDRRETLDTWRADFEVSTRPEEPTEAAELLFGLLEQLPPKDRLVLTLLYFEELDTREIGERLGWSRSLVKVRAFRARQKLKTMLEDEGMDGVGYAKPTA